MIQYSIKYENKPGGSKTIYYPKNNGYILLWRDQYLEVRKIIDQEKEYFSSLFTHYKEANNTVLEIIIPYNRIYDVTECDTDDIDFF